MNSNHITPTYPWYNPSRISAWRSTGEGNAIAQTLIKNRPLLVATLFDVEFAVQEEDGAMGVVEEVIEAKDVIETEVNLPSEVALDHTPPDPVLPKEVATEASTTLDVIETFLKCDNLRIVADEKSDVASRVTIEVELDDIDDLVTEELAEIYIAQGLIEEGKAIYIKLSLLNSEKSVYFAELIENLEEIES